MTIFFELFELQKLRIVNEIGIYLPEVNK